MRDVDLAFSGAVPVWIGLASIAAVSVVVWWAYKRNRHQLTGIQIFFLPLLRGVLLLLLLCCLVEPVLSYRATSDAQPPVLFLMDTSRSMSIADAPGGVERLDSALQPWLGADGLANRIEQQFPVHYYAFDARTRQLDGHGLLANQSARGQMTLLGEALASATALAGTSEASGIVLLTDGAHQSTVDPVAQARAIGAPIYVVAVGAVQASHVGKPDLAILDVVGDRFMSLNAENSLAVRLEHRGDTGETATVEVFDEDRLMAVETLEWASQGAGAGTHEVELRVKPEILGKRVFEVAVRPFDSEELIENNRREFPAIVEKRHISVLYVEGNPRWEYKFLKRALERDPSVQFTGFIRGRSDLFVRQGQEVGGGVLPTTSDEFSAYDVLILGDVSPDLFSRAQLESMCEVVQERGKGLILLPGTQSREGGGFESTPLAQVLPATVTSESPYAVAGEFVPRLTSAGREHPVFAGLGPRFSGGSRLALPNCLVLTEPGPASSVLAVHPHADRRGKPLPVCLVQTSGKGRTLVMGIDNTWRWRMDAARGPEVHSLYVRFWAQAVRWVAGRQEEGAEDVPFIAYAGRESYDPGEPVVLYARVRVEGDKGAEADVTADVTGPLGTVLAAALEYVPGSGGLYKTTLSFDDPGEYAAHVSAAKDGEPLGEDTTTFFMGHPYGEFDKVDMNEQLLRTLAFETGGEFHTPESAAAIPDALMETAAQTGVFVERDVARMPGVYGAMVACAAIEWFLRKRRGLM